MLKNSVGALAILLWVAFAGLLFISGYLVLKACSTGWGWFNYCAPPAQLTLVDIQKENKSLLLQRAEWLSRINQAKQCVIPEPEPEPEPEEEVVQEEEITEEELAECQVPPADDLLVLVDVSGSMKYDYDLDPAIEREFAELDKRWSRAGFSERARLNQRYQQLDRQADTPGKINRIDVAKQALRPLARNLPDNTNVKLMSFAECNLRIRNEGNYSRAQAGAYESAVNRMGLRSSTALAKAIDELPSKTQAGRSADRPVNIVILSDGLDNCGGDPCAAAARLKRALPYANVSVVSLAKAASANSCIAEATNGRFLKADDVEGLMRAVRRTVGQLSPEECRAVARENDQGSSSSEEKK